MFKIEDLQIKLTRGDVGVILFTADNPDGTPYTFIAGDKIKMNVFSAKKCDQILMQKEILVKEDTTSVEILLESKDTRMGGIINKVTDCWYEIILETGDNSQTILGYDDDGPKILSLYPEGGTQ